jgi:hypothetical protein
LQNYNIKLPVLYAQLNEDAFCSNVGQFAFYRNQKLQDFIDLLISDPSYQMKSPGVTTSIGGKNKTLYMSKVASIEEATR